MEERFNSTPKVQTKLNILPKHQEEESSSVVGLGRFPSWLHRKLPVGNTLWDTKAVVKGKRLHTVCEEAKCPNLMHCWSKKSATFLVMGKECTRACGFCEIDFSKEPQPLDKEEPLLVAQSVLELGLKHVVITQVARDDLVDGGASHLVDIVNTIKTSCKETTIELLTSDFQGNLDALALIVNSQIDIFNHNIETVRRLTPRVRHIATYDRTLKMLTNAKALKPTLLTKSGLMVGLGETEEEVHETIQDLQKAGVDIITMGQYLQPSRHKLKVKSFIHPDQFKAYEEYGLKLGIKQMYCGPFVRSSYNADDIFNQATKK